MFFNMDFASVVVKRVDFTNIFVSSMQYTEKKIPFRLSLTGLQGRQFFLGGSPNFLN